MRTIEEIDKDLSVKISRKEFDAGYMALGREKYQAERKHSGPWSSVQRQTKQEKEAMKLFNRLGMM